MTDNRTTVSPRISQRQQAEEWRPVVGFENRYEVSSLGRVRSLPWETSFVWRGRSVTRTFAGRVLRPCRTVLGYVRVLLYTEDGTGRVSDAVHRLVCASFHGPQPSGKEVNHINCIRDDNRAENLEWVTKVENNQHRELYGKSSKGAGNGNATLDEAAARDIRSRYGKGCTPTKLAREYGVSIPTVWAVIYRRTWKHVL